MNDSEADGRIDDDDDESAHLLPRDVTVTSRDVDEPHCSDDERSSSATVMPSGIGDGGGGGGGAKVHYSRSSSTGARFDLGHALSRHVKRLSADGVVHVDDDDDGASLLPRRSPTQHCYGTLCPPDAVHHQKLPDRLRRLSFAEVVERITLTWENVDVYAPPATSTPLVLRALGGGGGGGGSASAASADCAQPKHILKDGSKETCFTPLSDLPA